MTDPAPDSEIRSRLQQLVSSWDGDAPSVSASRLRRAQGGGGSAIRAFGVVAVAFAMVVGFAAVATATPGFQVPFTSLHVGGPGGLVHVEDASDHATGPDACPPKSKGCATPRPGLRLGQDGGAPGRDTTGPAPGSNGKGPDASPHPGSPGHAQQPPKPKR